VTPADLLDTTVAAVLASCPEAARVFLDRGMGCPGCPFAAFETVSEVARVYGLEASELAAALLDAGVRHHQWYVRPTS
jgi:hybrid cluster-associated redox disulfide protein